MRQVRTFAVWLEGVFQGPQYSMVGLRLWGRVGTWGLGGWCSWPPSPQCGGNPYRLIVHLWGLQLSKQSALETKASEIWELGVPRMLLHSLCVQSCCLGLATKSLGRNKESLSQGLNVPRSSPYHQLPFLLPELLGGDCEFPVGKCGVGRTGHLVYNSLPSLKPFCSLSWMILYLISHGSEMYFIWGFTYNGTAWRGAYCPSNLLSCLLQLFSPWLG